MSAGWSGAPVRSTRRYPIQSFGQILVSMVLVRLFISRWNRLNRWKRRFQGVFSRV